MSVQQEKFKEIADAIREKTGSTDLIKPSEFASKVGEVYEAGQQSEYDRFWNYHQVDGTRTNYSGFFAGPAWTNDNANPKYDIKPEIFQYAMWNTGIKRLSKNFGKNGVIVDFNKCWQFSYAFSYSNIEYVEELDVSRKGSTMITQSMFSNCTKLVTIEKMICNEAFTYSNTSFASCTMLANIAIEGTIGCSFSFQWSPLTAESAINVITHLKDYSGTDSEFANTLTLSSKTKTALEAEGATSPNGNTWAEYIKDIGWNLA